MKRFTKKMLASAMAATLAVSALSMSAITASAANLVTPTQGVTPAAGQLAKSIALNKTQLTVATGQALKGDNLLIATISPNNTEIQDVTWSLAATAADLTADKNHGQEVYDATLEEFATTAGNAVYTELGLNVNGAFTDYDQVLGAPAQYQSGVAAVDTKLNTLQTKQDALADLKATVTTKAADLTAAAGADADAKKAATLDLITEDTYGSAAAAMRTAFNNGYTGDDDDAKLANAVAAANDKYSTLVESARTAVETAEGNVAAEKDAAIQKANTTLSNNVSAAKTAARKNAANVAAAKEAQANSRAIDDQGYYKDATNNGVVSLVRVAADGKVDTSANAEKLNKYIQVVGISEGKTTVRVQTTDGTNKSAICSVTVKASVPVDPTVGVGFKIKEDNLTLGTDSTVTLTPQIQGVRDVDNKVQTATATADDITWESSDPSTATVDEHGVVTPKKAGTAYILATLKDEYAVGGVATYTYSTAITVTEPVAVTDITLDKSSGTVAVGESVNVKATISPLTASNKKITWSSYDPSIATVEQVGDVTEGNTTYTVAKVTGKKSGTTTIIATTQSGTKTALYTVTVGSNGSRVVNDTGVALNVLSGTLNVGETAELQATITPENATNKETTWISTDPAVATVEYTGPITKNGSTKYCASVKALQKGVTTIRVKTAAGNYAECTVTVTENGIREWNETKVGILDTNNQTYDLKDTTSHQINFQPTPGSAVVTWASSDSSVATVDANGLVTFKKAGTVAITGTVQNGVSKVTETLNIVVKDTRGNTNPSTANMILTVDGKTPLQLLKIANVSRRFQIIPAFNGVTGYDANSVLWKSSDTRYFQIDANGWVNYNEVLMTSVSSYQATITGTTADGKYSASFTIVSYANLSADEDDIAKLKDGVKITYNNNVVTALKAKWKSNLHEYTYKLDSLLSGTKYTKSQLQWSVDRPDLASIDQTGTLKIIATEDQAASNPKFVVTVASPDKAISANCEVTISKNFTDGEADIKCNDPAYTGDPFTLQFDGKDVDNSTVGVTAPKNGDDTYQARALLAADAPIAGSDITWSSSDRNVADVSSTGVVTIYPVTKEKTVEITAKASKNGTTWSKSFKIKVSPAEDDIAEIVDDFEFNPSTLTLTVGDGAKQVSPDGGTAVKWSSSKPGIATVDNKGNITPVSAGTAVITAEDANGTKAKLTVTVKAATATPTDTGDTGNYLTMTPEELNALINQKVNEALKNASGNSGAVTDPNTGKVPTGNPKTGVGLALIPAAIAGAGVVIFRKKRK